MRLASILAACGLAASALAVAAIPRAQTQAAAPPNPIEALQQRVDSGAVTLERSTNLVNWAATTNGIYTDLSSAMFFRM